MAPQTSSPCFHQIPKFAATKERKLEKQKK
jgi:hypothetical protein